MCRTSQTRATSRLAGPRHPCLSVRPITSYRLATTDQSPFDLHFGRRSLSVFAGVWPVRRNCEGVIPVLALKT